MRSRLVRYTVAAALLLVAAIALAKVLNPPWPWLYSGWVRAMALPETKANTRTDTTVIVTPP